MNKFSQVIYVIREKIEIFKGKQNKTVGYNGYNQKKLPFSAFRIFNQNAGRIVDNNQKEQNKNILWYEKYVKNRAGNQKKRPSKFMGQEEI